MTSNPTGSTPRLPRVIAVTALALTVSVAAGYAVGYGARRLQDDGLAAGPAALVLIGLAAAAALVARMARQRRHA